MENLQEGPISAISGFADIAKKYATDPNFRKNMNLAIQTGSKVMGRVLSNNEKSMLNEIAKKEGTYQKPVSKPKPQISLGKTVDTIILDWKKTNGELAKISVNPSKNPEVWNVIASINTDNFKPRDEIGFVGIPTIDKLLKINNHTKKFAVTIPKINDIVTDKLSINPLVDKIDKANPTKDEELDEDLAIDPEDDTELVRNPDKKDEIDEKVEKEEIEPADTKDDVVEPTKPEPKKTETIIKDKPEAEKMVESIYVDKNEIKTLLESIKYF